MRRNVVALARLTIAMGYGWGVCADAASAQDRPLSADFVEVYRAGGVMGALQSSIWGISHIRSSRRMENRKGS